MPGITTYKGFAIMKAAFLTGIRKVEVMQADMPEITKPDDVLLRVEVVGVCGSDLHYYRNGRIGDEVIKFPWPICHEFGATVVEVGPQVSGVEVGARVAVDPLISCLKCDQCLSGREHTCRDQVFMGCPGELPGCLSEYLVMPARCCYPISESMTLVDAAMSEPFSICLYAQRLSGQADGAKIGILGAGPIGLGVLAAMRATTECKTYVTDLLDERIAIAAKLGADWTGNAATGDMVKEISQAEPGGLDCVFECAGEPETLDQAVELLAPGGKLVIVGIPEAGRISLSMGLLRRKELSIQNVRRQNKCIGPALEMMANGKVDIGSLVTHHFPFDKVSEAFELVADYRDGVIKAMIHMTGDC